MLSSLALVPTTMRAMIRRLNNFHNWRFAALLIRYSLRFSIVLLLGSQLLPGQGSDKRQEEAIAEISFLKRVVAEQDRRISELEKTVSALERAAKPQIPVVGTQIGGAVPPNSATAWKTPAAWSRLKHGMSRAQVEALLGRPTSTKITEPYLTLFYQGDVLGSGSVTGTIGITDDRVWQVNIPVF